LNASKFSRTFTLDHIKTAVSDFVCDILTEEELSAEVKGVQVRGFEDGDTSFLGPGTAEVGLSFKAISGQTSDASVYVPIYKGEVYRPSVMLLEGKKMVFSPIFIMELMKKKESVKVEATWPFLKQPRFFHEPNIDNAQGKGPFSMKPSVMVEPYYDPIYNITDTSRK
jgi:hypothetical protein